VISLSAAALSSLPADVSVPAYDRSAVTVGIVHIGVGGFHRAHQAMYLDRILNGSKGLDWGICGVGVLPGDARMRDALRSQDHLYTLVVKHPDGSLDATVIGSIVDFLLAPDDPEAVLERMAAPSTRIVSLTVTEGGYHVNTVTGELDATAAALAADLVPGAVPHSAFGLIIEALMRRRSRGIEPFTIQSCDNILGNGDVARRMLTAFARLRDPELAEWMSAHVAFPNSMVDRITPVTTEADRALIAEHFGIDDLWPVVCEPYTQWVLQDDFPTGRPEWESVGAQLVEDVEPYELMKLRLLNGSHQAVAYVGHLAGFRYVHDACQDPLIAGFLMDYMDREATPTLAPVPGVDLDSYKRTLIERFANPAIGDTIARLAEFSSDRIPNWMVPIIVEQLERGGEVSRMATVVASWARYAEGIDEHGNPIHVVDRLKDRVMAAASHNANDSKAFLRDADLFGSLVDDERFTAEYVAALASFHAVGARATLDKLAAR
jgi:mannitol 2-dehydrogenase